VTQCIRCQQVKFWFSFYRKDYGQYVAVYPVCKRCARDLMHEAVDRYVMERERDRRADAKAKTLQVL
jgi:hypothetical protein